jgi:putative ABC transport system permease protein
LLPREFRQDFAQEMVILLDERLREAGSSVMSRLWIWTLALGDLLWQAPSLYHNHHRSRSSRGPGAATTGRFFGSLAQDLRFAFRTLRRSPGFAIVAGLTLAVGIGANTVMFSLVNGVLLRPLPYGSPEQLVWLRELTDEGRELWASYPNYRDWRDRSSSFRGLAAGFHPSTATIRVGDGEPFVGRGMGISTDFLSVFGVTPISGRGLLPEENLPGSSFSVLVSHRFWTEHLGGAATLDGVTLQLEGTIGQGAIGQVVGVLPSDFQFLGDVDVWFSHERSPIEIRNAHNYWVVARLGDDVPLAQARAELNRIHRGIKETFPKETSSSAVEMRPLRDEIVGVTRRPLLLLMTASGLLLLIACVNVASTLLARGVDRQREMAVRSSIGAGRGRLIRLLMSEGLFLATLGGAGGVLLGHVIMRLVQTHGAAMIPRLQDVSLDGTVLLFALLATLGTTLVFGLFPALRLSRGVSRMTHSGRGAGRDALQSVIWRVLIGGEVGLAVLLMIGSGLLIRSLGAILSAEAGYDGSRIVTASFNLSSESYTTDESRALFLDRVLRELGELPGAEQVGITGATPMQGGIQTGPVLVPPVTRPEDPDEWKAIAGFRVVSDGYFGTRGIPLLQGRGLGPDDVVGGPGVAVVNASLAERLWPDASAVGQRVMSLWDFRGEELTVVGVVGEARHWSREVGGQPEIYMSFRQRPEHILRGVTATIRTSGRPAPAIPAIRARFAALDSDLRPIFSTVRAEVSSSARDRRFTMFVLAGFAGAGLLLAIVGIYGVVSHAVSRRAREIGIRLALGATTTSVMVLVQRGTLTWVVAGTTVGLLSALLFGRFMESLLYDITATDPTTYLLVAGLLVATGALAAYVPARRSTRIDPAATMRLE